MERLREIQNQLIKASRKWALQQDFDLLQAQELRHEAIRINHAHYYRHIPVYRKLAQEEGCCEDADIEAIKKKLMLAADIFKSYDQGWLDGGNFKNMVGWLSSIYHKRIDADMSGVRTIDDWIERLGTTGIDVVYSSGSSGSFSFVPRNRQDRKLSRAANVACLTPLLSRRMGNALSRILLEPAVQLMPSDTFDRLVGKRMLPDFDAAFLGFRHGKMGNQSLMAELAPLFRRCYYLYDYDISGTALRCLVRGARTDEEQQLLSEFQEKTIRQREAHYLKLIDNIQKSIDERRKIFIFGAPYQFKELCDVAVSHKRRLALRKGSLVLFGGGWKSFAGEAMAREALVGKLSDALNTPPEMILEGYSMTEINVLMLRCEHGRFHIPPILEPVIFDEELNPIKGSDLKGAFGFLDPLAVSYPGFIISGDYVHVVDGKCGCGLHGTAILEIGRMPGAGVKGCGGIMSSMQA